MTYARLVIEEEIPDGASDSDIISILNNCMSNLMKSLYIDDVELSECPYERQE